MSSLFLKIAGSTTVGVGGISGASYLIYQNFSEKAIFQKQLKKNDEQKLFSGNTTKTTPTSIFIVSTSKTGFKADQLVSLDNTTRNYKCVLKISTEKTDDNCVVKLIKPLDEQKRQINISSLKTNTWTEPTLGELKSFNNYFQVEVTADFYSGVTWDQNIPQIDVLSTDATPKVLSSLIPILGVKDSEIKGTTLYSAGKVSKFYKGSTADENTTKIKINKNSSKCVFTNSENNGFNCSIFRFSDSTNNHSSINELMFSSNKEQLSEIDKNKFYLFKFNESTNAKEKSNFKTTGNDVKVVLDPKSESNDIDKIEISDLVPIIIAENSQNSFVFLLTSN